MCMMDKIAIFWIIGMVIAILVPMVIMVILGDMMVAFLSCIGVVSILFGIDLYCFHEKEK